ncbi:hypothetical protein GS416_09305 [Rhodococcus hoagii]|nr:hypothetical protein [Prescottella equi]
MRMIGLGCDLRWRLSRVRAAFATGRIDLAKAHALAEILAKVSDECSPRSRNDYSTVPTGRVPPG